MYRLVLGVVCFLSTTLEAQETIAIRNARIYTVSGAAIPSGTLVMSAGKIAAVGPNVAVPPGARVIEAGGKSVMPGLVESHSHMGMKRLSVPADLNNELLGPINPHQRPNPSGSLPWR